MKISLTFSVFDHISEDEAESFVTLEIKGRGWDDKFLNAMELSFSILCSGVEIVNNSENFEEYLGVVFNGSKLVVTAKSGCLVCGLPVKME